MLNNKTVLITGGTGSFGKMCKIFIEKFKLKKLIIFQDELKQYHIFNELQEIKKYQIKIFIGMLEIEKD